MGCLPSKNVKDEVILVQKQVILIHELPNQKKIVKQELKEPTQDEPTQDEPTQDEPTQDEPTQEEPTQDELQNFLLNSTYKNTPPFFPSFTQGKCVKVYDGDTFHMTAIVDNKVQRFMIRAMGYDSPELRSKNPAEKLAGYEAKKVLQDRIEGKMITVTIHRIKEKFGRLLATVSDENGEINSWMIENGYGVPYSGGTKQVFVSDVFDNNI